MQMRLANNRCRVQRQSLPKYETAEAGSVWAPHQPRPYASVSGLTSSGISVHTGCHCIISSTCQPLLMSLEHTTIGSLYWVRPRRAQNVPRSQLSHLAGGPPMRLCAHPPPPPPSGTRRCYKSKLIVSVHIGAYLRG